MELDLASWSSCRKTAGLMHWRTLEEELPSEKFKARAFSKQDAFEDLSRSLGEDIARLRV